MSFRIFTDATADLDYTKLGQPLPFSVLDMAVTVGDDLHSYGPGGDITAPEFYQRLRGGEFASTSLISPASYKAAFEPYLAQGQDIIYLCLTTGLSGTMGTAQLAAQDLREKYPDRKIIIHDSLCASIGEGFLVKEARRMQDQGFSLDQVSRWVEANNLKVCHWFVVDGFDHLRHGGRVSQAAATVGSLLQIKPLLRLNEVGQLQVMDKPRGKQKALRALVNKLKEGWQPDLGNLVLVGHGDNPTGAAQLAQLIEAEFPQADLEIADIGPVIGSHTGPGMLALAYWGNNR